MLLALQESVGIRVTYSTKATELLISLFWIRILDMA